MVTTIREATTLTTVEQLLEMRIDLGRLELWEGEVVEVSPAGGPHAFLIDRLWRAMADAAMEARVGRVWTGDLGYVLHRNRDVVLGPDLALIRAEYLVNVSVDGEGYHEYVPPLVVEVKSPTDREKDIREKLALYLRYGVEEVWWVRPKRRTVTRYRADAEPVELGPDDTLDGGELPGLSLPVGRLFVPPTLEW